MRCHTRARIALDGCAVIADDEHIASGALAFRAHKIFAHHPHRGVFTYHFFDSEGATPLTCAQGQWMVDALSLTRQTPFGPVRYRFAFEDAEVFDYRMDASEDGQAWTGYQWGRFQKAGAETASEPPERQ